MENKNIDFKLCEIEISELELVLSPYELGIVLRGEKSGRDTDILFQNMLHYYVTEEKYDYAIIIRDEIHWRAKKRH